MKQFEKILEKIARKNGTTPGDVRDQMQRAIDQAYDHPADGAAPLWAELTFRGERPTPEELVLQLAALLQKNTTSAG